MELIIPLFEQAENVRSGQPIDDALISALFAEYVEIIPDK